MGKRFAQLGYSYAYPEDTAADQALYNSGTVYMPASSSAGGPSALPAGSSLSIPGSGAITPSEAALISQGITTAGKIGTQAIIGTPTVTYNAATGQYTATGGATIPAGSIAANSIFQTLLSPTVLLLGGGLLVVLAFAGKR
jgi:hypothetical protein